MYRAMLLGREQYCNVQSNDTFREQYCNVQSNATFREQYCNVQCNATFKGAIIECKEQ